jgi:serine/tyrosine/threonine adenylyltransferase
MRSRDILSAFLSSVPLSPGSRISGCAPRSARRMASMSSDGPVVAVRGTRAPDGPAGVYRLVFEDSFVRTQPADPETANFVRRDVKGAAFSFVNPTDPRSTDQRAMWRRSDPEGEAAATPQLPRGIVAWSYGAASEILDLSPADLPAGAEEEAVIDVFGGFGMLLPGMRPYAACYSGHQFGSFAGQLGDGRAITLGEYVNSKGERWDVQLKGAGQTPYSRNADGRAVLRSSVREFLASEAMFHLGIPTTRALSLISTGTGVIRDMFYDGNQKMEAGAVVTRLAQSLIRIGSFENPASAGDTERLKKLADYAIEYHFKNLLTFPDDVASPERNRYGAFLAEVTRLNAEMVAQWQGVGFVHGVGNVRSLPVSPRRFRGDLADLCILTDLAIVLVCVLLTMFARRIIPRFLA